ncbi:hypothetical protein BDW62DRAFT_205024 [Aspergillus aurantiobrunneus]
MVRVQHPLLGIACLASQLAWAAPNNSGYSGIELEQRDQFAINFCPRTPKKCSECGGDSRQKGFCDDELAQGWMSGYNACLRIHDEGECGLICECISEETGEPGSGAPAIIPFPIIPVGFVAPPAAVPNPKQTCPDDYTTTSCKDCEPLEGWCTKGDHTGCPCREECRAANDETKPSCSAEDCEGKDGSCTVGHYKGCECKAECPNQEDKVLFCSYDYCKGEENDHKCTADAYNGCECSDLIETVYTTLPIDFDEAQKVLAELIENMEETYQDEGDQEETKPEVTCSSRNYNDALPVDASLLNKLAEKFCSGDTSKKRTQDLTAKDVSSSANEGYKFHFELDPGDNCEADCVAAYKSMTGRCQGIDSHSIQASASAKNGLQERVCHNQDAFGDHGDVRRGDISRAALGCLQMKDDKAILSADSEAIELKPTYGGTKLAFTISWIEGCEGAEVDERWPKGKGHADDTCYQYLVDNWDLSIVGIVDEPAPIPLLRAKVTEVREIHKRFLAITAHWLRRLWLAYGLVLCPEGRRPQRAGIAPDESELVVWGEFVGGGLVSDLIDSVTEVLELARPVAAVGVMIGEAMGAGVWGGGWKRRVSIRVGRVRVWGAAIAVFVFVLIVTGI